MMGRRAGRTEIGRWRIRTGSDVFVCPPCANVSCGCRITVTEVLIGVEVSEAEGLNADRVSPQKRHRPVSADHGAAEGGGSVSPKHRKIVEDEGINDAIAASPMASYPDEQLAWLFARNV